LKRAQVIETLIDKAGRSSITVSRDGAERSFDLVEATKHKRGGKHSATVSELRQALQLWLGDHPEFQGRQFN
jgi:hypothetical protein